MKSRLILNDGDRIEETSHKMEGFMQETDIYTYSIINANGEIVGTVEYTDHTAVKGFRRTQSVTQKDFTGKILVDITW